MKILCVMPNYWPAVQFGGPIFCIHDLNKALVKNNVDLTVYTTNSGLDGKVETNIEVEVDGVKVTYFKENSIMDLLGQNGWQFSLSLTKAIKDNIRSFDLVYIIYIWNYPVAAASYYARKFGVPYILSPVGTLYNKTKSHKSWKKTPYYNLISKRDLKNASAVHYTTEHEYKMCHNELKLENKALVIPNGINLTEYEILPDALSLHEKYPHLYGKKVILFLGRICWIKGLDKLIKAFAKLSRNKGDLHLLIVGNDEDNYVNEIKELIEKLQLNYIDLSEDHDNNKIPVNANITFTGMLTDRDKLLAYSGSDMFVLPSYSENFGMAVIEAMASKTPVIISNNVGIYREVERNNAGIVIENTVEELASAMETLLENENLSNELSQNGHQLVTYLYDIDSVAGSMINAFKDTIDSRNKK